MLTSGGYPCDVELMRRALWPDLLAHAWAVRLLRASWRRGLALPRATLERAAARVVAALVYLRDRLARRLPWAVRLARCGAPRVALRSLSQAVRGVSR